MRLNQWAPYENAIETCREDALNQTMYFLQRDLTFMRDVRYNESLLQIIRPL